MEGKELTSNERFWRDHIIKCYSDDRPVKTYLIENGLTEGKFYFWKTHLHKKKIIKKCWLNKKRRFVSVEIEPDKSYSNTEAIKIHFPNGIILELQGYSSQDRIVSFIKNWI